MGTGVAEPANIVLHDSLSPSTWSYYKTSTSISLDSQWRSSSALFAELVVLLSSTSTLSLFIISKKPDKEEGKGMTQSPKVG